MISGVLGSQNCGADGLFVDLVGGGQRQGPVPERDAARRFVIGDFLAAEGDQVSFAESGALMQGNHGIDNFAPF